ncbi:hypothetical protein DXG01_005385 [Tephrocybe rancida]|nr:hypothetical protein DXG01_005385 [Tephrocybe rancida]
MFSLRTIFLVAATALATVSLAAPTGPVNQSSQVVSVDKVLNNVAQNVDVHNIKVTGVDLGKRDQPAQTVNGNTGGVNADGSVESLLASLKTRDGPQSLPTLLVDARAKLEVVLKDLNIASNGKPTVDVKILVGIIGQVQVILCALLEAVKLLVGSPIEVILCLEGKVLALVDVCALLTAVLSLVCIILTCVLRLVASASLHIVLPLIAGVGAVLCELLDCLLTLVPGILVTLSPTLGPVIEILVSLKLDAVVAILKPSNGPAPTL